jgi:hypothetical protein
MARGKDAVFAGIVRGAGLARIAPKIKMNKNKTAVYA